MRIGGRGGGCVGGGTSAAGLSKHAPSPTRAETRKNDSALTNPAASLSASRVHPPTHPPTHSFHTSKRALTASAASLSSSRSRASSRASMSGSTKSSTWCACVCLCVRGEEGSGGARGGGVCGRELQAAPEPQAHPPTHTTIPHPNPPLLTLCPSTISGMMSYRQAGSFKSYSLRRSELYTPAPPCSSCMGRGVGRAVLCVCVWGGGGAGRAKVEQAAAAPCLAGSPHAHMLARTHACTPPTPTHTPAHPPARPSRCAVSRRQRAARAPRPRPAGCRAGGCRGWVGGGGEGVRSRMGGWGVGSALVWTGGALGAEEEEHQRTGRRGGGGRTWLRPWAWAGPRGCGSPPRSHACSGGCLCGGRWGGRGGGGRSAGIAGACGRERGGTPLPSPHPTPTPPAHTPTHAHLELHLHPAAQQAVTCQLLNVKDASLCQRAHRDQRARSGALPALPRAP